MSHIPFSPIQNHDNTEQARIYPAKLKDIVSGRQSAIIAGLNKCKILTGTNASNWSRTPGYIFPFCSPPLLGMYLCSLASDHPGRLGRRVQRHCALCGPARPAEVDGGAGIGIKQDAGEKRHIKAASALFLSSRLMRFKCAGGAGRPVGAC